VIADLLDERGKYTWSEVATILQAEDPDDYHSNDRSDELASPTLSRRSTERGRWACFGSTISSVTSYRSSVASSDCDTDSQRSHCYACT
jgi:hypothetical protein